MSEGLGGDLVSGPCCKKLVACLNVAAESGEPSFDEPSRCVLSRSLPPPNAGSSDAAASSIDMRLPFGLPFAPASPDAAALGEPVWRFARCALTAGPASGTAPGIFRRFGSADVADRLVTLKNPEGDAPVCRLGDPGVVTADGLPGSSLRSVKACPVGRGSAVTPDGTDRSVAEPP